MKLIIRTHVWAGEFDQAEFPHYVSHHYLSTRRNTVEVLEVIELNPESSITIEP